MNFLIVSHVDHVKTAQGEIGGYGPYVKEMNIWLKYCDKVTVIAPLGRRKVSPIDLMYTHKKIHFISVSPFQLTSIKYIFHSLFIVPGIVLKLIVAMKRADHIHLRCPGNMGLLGAIVQIFFPKKQKTAKYAANWDWESKQPWSYRLQQNILKNTFLTRNMQVLVYGNWPRSTKNVKPFFTASYSEKEIKETPVRSLKVLPLKLIYVGGLVEGKQPLTSIKVCEALNSSVNTELHLYGDGVLRKEIVEYIEEKELKEKVFLHGNCDANEVKEAFQKSHFLIFISKSEGWPKVVAEAMFWGCLPITTKVSCVPEMVDYGKRGELVKNDIDEIVSRIKDYLLDNSRYQEKALQAMRWSRSFTLEKFENEIKTLVQ